MRRPPQAEMRNVRDRVPVKDGSIIQQRKYQLITPLLGGGVKAGETDPITVINGKSVRGQLRFWWRATRGGQFGGSLQRMREVEELIWGAASDESNKRPSLVQIVITIDSAGQPESYRDWCPNELKYAAFPLQRSNASIRHQVKFMLHASFEARQINFTDAQEGRRTIDAATEVNAALWAWETFGGIGARTRRGFGALQLLSLGENGERRPIFWGEDGNTANTISPMDRLKAGYRQYYSVGDFPMGVACLPENLGRLVLCRATDCLDAWTKLIRRLKDFRQMRPGGPAPGRSKWPEPEHIRRITGQRLPRHGLIPPNVDSFPRMQFGAPIVFEFRHDNDANPRDPNADPRKTVLQFENQNKPIQRWASPLILRPLAIGQGGFAALAVYLKGSNPPFPPALYEADGRTLVRGGLHMDLTTAQQATINGVAGAPPLTVRSENGRNYVDTVLDFLDTL